jgi:hypothetical protein
MKSIVITLILALSFATLLGACSESRHAATPDRADTLGTGDSGGGNLYKGRPIESYSVDITQLPAYQAKIAPIVTALTDVTRFSSSQQMSSPDLGRMVLAILQKRTWYLIPGELEALPKERTGIAVASVQGALQSSKEIWINSVLFQAMTEDDQASLILHEILMGLRILKFASNQEQCLSYSPRPEYCDGNSKKPNGEIDQLGPQDYADIRAAGLELMKSYNSLTYEGWDDLMARNNFSMGTRSFRFKQDRGETATDEVLRKIKRAYISLKLPSFGFKGSIYSTTPRKADETCKIEFQGIQTGKVFELTLKTPSVDRHFKVDLSDKETLTFYRYETYNQQKLTQYSVSEFKNRKTIKVGDRQHIAGLLFDQDNFVGVRISEFVYTEVSTDGGYSGENPKDGFTYICTDQETLSY